jgi:hypothetical protein
LEREDEGREKDEGKKRTKRSERNESLKKCII